MFTCPNCKEILCEEDKRYVCKNGHSFDKSKEGYVNLLLSQASSKKRHGDDKAMVSARKRFLSGDHYAHLKDALAQKVIAFSDKKDIKLLDAGCGECYYSEGIKDQLGKCGIFADVYGIDISKNAVAAAKKRANDFHLAVAGVNKLPFADDSLDVIISVFAPFCAEEFSRVLSHGGIAVRAIPLENHLYELKAKIYDKPYLNEVTAFDEPPFEIIDCYDIKKTVHLPTNEVINDLFLMTPYYYKTSESDQKKLFQIQSLDVTTEFRIITYKKH